MFLYYVRCGMEGGDLSCTGSVDFCQKVLRYYSLRAVAKHHWPRAVTTAPRRPRKAGRLKEPVAAGKKRNFSTRS